MKPALKWDVDFRCQLLRLWFEAQAPIQFPAAMTANLFRGALGTALPGRLFSPRYPSGPSGLADPPRPFVLRARHLDGLALRPGQRFPLHVHLFSPIAADLIAAFRQAAPLHGSVRLVESSPLESVAFPLAPLGCELSRVTIHFLTPTELKLQSGLAAQPHFPVLFARAASRLRTLASLYNEPIALDWARLAQLSESVRLTGHSLTHESADRYSTRTGQTHPLGGFTGRAHYQGDLRELLPLLDAASFTGVGRQTVWGKGEIVLKR